MREILWSGIAGLIAGAVAAVFLIVKARREGKLICGDENGLEILLCLVSPREWFVMIAILAVTFGAGIASFHFPQVGLFCVFFTLTSVLLPYTANAQGRARDWLEQHPEVWPVFIKFAVISFAAAAVASYIVCIAMMREAAGGLMIPE